MHQAHVADHHDVLDDDDEVERALFEAITGPDDHAACQAAQVIATMGEQLSTEAMAPIVLLQALTSPDSARRLSMAMALRHMPIATSLLTEHLAHPERPACEAAVVALGAPQHHGAVDALETLSLQRQAPVAIRVAAIEALVALYAKASVVRVAHEAVEAPAELRVALCQSLAALHATAEGATLIGACVADAQAAVRLAALRACLHDETLSPLATAALAHPTCPDTRVLALRVLLQHDALPASSLVALSRDSDARVRQLALQHLV